MAEIIDSNLVPLCNLAELKIWPVGLNGPAQAYDLLRNNTFLYIDIFENLFSYFLTAELAIKDFEDIINNLPIIGGELLTVKYQETITAPFIELSFIIYKYTTGNRTEGDTAQRGKFIKFFLVSQEGFDAINNKISRVFKGTINDIIESQLFQNPRMLPSGSNKKINAEKFSTTLSIISNFWCSSEIINFATNITDPYDVLFYQTGNGQYNLKRLDTLIKESAAAEVLYYAKNTNLPNAIDLINKIEHGTKKDLTTFVEDGGFGGTYYKWDETSNSIIKKELLQKDTITRTLDSGAYYNVPLNLQDSTSDYRQSFFNINTSSYRNITLGTIDSINCLIMVLGKSSREVGQNIDIQYLVNDSNLSEPNNLYSGKWLMTEIKHSITNMGVYYQTIKSIKNGYNSINTTPAPSLVLFTPSVIPQDQIFDISGSSIEMTA